MKLINVIAAATGLVSTVWAQGMAGRELAFQPNVGQGPAGAEFVARGREYAVSLARERVVLGVVDSECGERSIALELAGVLDGPRGEVGETRVERFGYFRGSDPTRWQANVPSFAGVRYRGVWPGIDVVYLASDGRLQYDFHVAAGADPSAIELVFDGVDGLRIGAGGALELATSFGPITQPAPTIYQLRDGERELVAGRFELRGERRVGFAIDAWDRGRELVIDPEVVWQSLIGGASEDTARSVRAASDGTLWVAGTTSSAGFPLAGFGTIFTANGGRDVFVSHLGSNGTTLLFSALIGGAESDEAWDSALVSDTELVVCGVTRSPDFPATTAIKTLPLQSSLAGGSDAFVFRIDDEGVFAFSTYLGGAGAEAATGCGLLAGDDVALCGYTTSGDFPVQNAAQPAHGGLVGSFDGFATRLAASGDALVWSTYSGDVPGERMNALAVDPSDDSVVAVGESGSPSNRARVVRYGANGALVDELVFGDAGALNEPSSVAIAADGSVVIGLTTSDPAFATVEAPAELENAFGGNDALVCVWDAALSTTTFAAYVGGDSRDTCADVAARDGRVYVLTATESDDVVLAQSVSPALESSSGAHIACIDVGQTPAVLEWATLVPAAESCVPEALELENAVGGALYVAGGYDVALDVGASGANVFPSRRFGVAGVQASTDAFVLRVNGASSPGTPVVGFGEVSLTPADPSSVPLIVYRSGGTDTACTIEYHVSTLGTPLSAYDGSISFAVGQQMATSLLGLLGLPSGTTYVLVTLDDSKSTATIEPGRGELNLMLDDYSEPTYSSESDDDDECCGVATVARASGMERDLDLMRGVRDELLSRFSAGREFTRWYYRDLSPTVVRFLREHPEALPFARAALWCVLFALAHPIELTALALALMMLRAHLRNARARTVLAVAR